MTTTRRTVHAGTRSRVMRYTGKNLILAVLASAMLVFSPRIGNAQCSGLCGDANNSNTVTSADIIAISNYLYAEGTLDAPGCGDMDTYELTTIRDILWLVFYVFKGGAAPNCPPGHPPYVPTPTTDYVVTFGNTFPANATSYTMNIGIISALGRKIQGMTLPLTILVDGVAPTLGTVTLGAGWSGSYFRIGPGGTAGNNLLLGFDTFGSGQPSGTYPLAMVDLTLPAAVVARTITLTWAALPPLESSQPVNYPMLVDENLVAWEPSGPGTVGGFGSIAGTKFSDDVPDCSQGLTEPGLAGYWIELLPFGLIQITDIDGHYTFPSIPPGNYTLLEILKPWSTQTCPITGTYTFSLASGQDLTGLNFGNQEQPFQDLAVSVGGARARPGFAKVYGVRCDNRGNISVNTDLELALPPEVTYVSSNPTGVYSAGLHTVSWSLGTLARDASTLVQTTVLVGVNTPLGSNICATATVNPVTGDDAPTNNVVTECQEVRGSWDPNAKLVTPEGAGAKGFVFREDTLNYHIDFQNTGNDTAFNIVVRDTLDPDMEIVSVQSGASSHSYTFTISGRELSWTFNSIMLPDSIIDEPGSHGFVEYSARPSATAQDGAALPNNAGIYFDFNQPVVTNTVTNTICPVVVKGDVNNSGLVTSADVISLVNYVFKGGVPPQPVIEAGDINCDGVHTSADIIKLVNFVFKSGLPPCDPCTEL